jgi:hypothetical protein
MWPVNLLSAGRTGSHRQKLNSVPIADSYIEDTVTGLSLRGGFRKTVMENPRCQIVAIPTTRIVDFLIVGQEVFSPR